MATNGEVNVDDASYVKKEYFQDILEKRFGKCSIERLVLEKNSGSGENYTSVMFITTIDVVKEDGSKAVANYMVKLMPPNDPMAGFKKQMRIFEKEIEMYGENVLRFEKLLRDHGVQVRLAPKLWKHLEDPEIMIMDNLKVEKYTNIDRLKGMDMEHTKMVLTKLAKFHAASVCIYESEGEYSPQLMGKIINKDFEKQFKQMQPMIWKSVCKNIRLWKSCQEYVDRIESLTERIADLFLESFKVDEDEFNVLLHGDLWSNNIMFQHDANGAPKEVIFVDLQVSRWGSPAQDLLYFIFSSTDLSIKVKEFDYFIAFYHKELIKNLDILDYTKPKPRLVDLHVSILRKIFFGLSVCFGVMAAALLDPTEKANIDNFLSDSDAGNQFKQDIFTNPRLIKACEVILPFLENKGVFGV